MATARSTAGSTHTTASRAPHAENRHRDPSAWGLIGANIVSLGVAVAGGWSIVDLMLVYWLQSAMIGASYCARILSLDEFSTENFTINNRPVAPTRETKIKTAAFFAVHYGFFHVVYLVFIAAEAVPGTFADPQIWACGVAFAISHVYSYHHNRDMDRRGTPNIGTLMFTPYLRIVPMHLTIVFGLASSTGFGLLVFGTLKTAADVAMHAVEHRLLARRRLEKRHSGDPAVRPQHHGVARQTHDHGSRDLG